jgi:twitching motility protein PilT
MQMHELFEQMSAQGASDLHITAGSPPMVRVNGDVAPMPFEELSPNSTKQLCYSVLTEQQKKKFEEENELDFSFSVSGLSRFRGNLFVQRGAVGGVFRAIPHTAPPLAKLGLPPAVENLIKLPRGLVLVTGPTGSGKSTTMAAMVDEINSTRAEHIMTVEDPIEFLHSHKKCIVNQREVFSDTHSFGAALKHILRQDPDVVLVGELRDLETIEAALTIAETGHLVFATLHTNSAVQTINRVIDVFSAGQQAQVRAQMSLVLEAVISQTLLARADGKGRVMACEVMIPNPAIRNLIREEKVHQIYGMMQTGQAKYGMQTFNQSLASLYFKRMITLQTALARSSYQDELQEIIARGPASLNPNVTEGQGAAVANRS